MGEVGYYLASFEAAVTHIREMDLSESREEMLEVAKCLKGQLTASIMGTDQDFSSVNELFRAVSDRTDNRCRFAWCTYEWDHDFNVLQTHLVTNALDCLSF